MIWRTHIVICRGHTLDLECSKSPETRLSHASDCSSTRVSGSACCCSGRNVSGTDHEARIHSLVTMSIEQPTNSTEPSSSQSHDTPTPLSEANVAAHNEATPASGPNSLSMQRWLDYRGDRLVSSQVPQSAPNGWTRLVTRDAMAADIERATQGRGNLGANGGN